MKNILLLFWFFSFTGYAQTGLDITKIASEFGTLVDENIGLFPADDVKLLNESVIPPTDTLDLYWSRLIDLPVSEDFMLGATAKIQLLYRLKYICQPLWEKEFSSLEEANAAHTALNQELDNFRNGKVAQYHYYRLLMIEGTPVRIIQFYRE